MYIKGPSNVLKCDINSAHSKVEGNTTFLSDCSCIWQLEQNYLSMVIHGHKCVNTFTSHTSLLYLLREVLTQYLWISHRCMNVWSVLKIASSDFPVLTQKMRIIFYLMSNPIILILQWQERKLHELPASVGWTGPQPCNWPRLQQRALCMWVRVKTCCTSSVSWCGHTN
jgi:hypothetical protein